MPVHIVSSKDVPITPMPGRTLQWLATRELLGSQQLALAIMECEPGAVVRPVHAHRDTEEILLVLEGEGDAWVEGEVGHFGAGDVVLFPANAKHVVRNSGSVPIRGVCVFAPPTSTASYVLCDDEVIW